MTDEADRRAIAIGIVGPGLVGKTLIAQLAEQADRLLKEWNLELQVYGVTDSRWMLLSATPIDLSTWQSALDKQETEANLDSFTYHFASIQHPADKIIIDCTASAAVPCFYTKAPLERSRNAERRRYRVVLQQRGSRWLSLGIHVVTPNKRMGSGPLQEYLQVKEAQRRYGAHFLAEASVGAGLPVLSTARSLLCTGDRISTVEGVFSGTLSYIFNTYGPGRSFSEVVMEAKKKGYTEPDPRDDLSGMDVARKVVILAREAGLRLELEAVEVQSLVPEPLRAAQSAAEFLDGLPQFDEEMAARAEEAETAGRKLVYVGLVEVASGRCTVGLKAYAKDHPFAQLSGSDNVISFSSRRYNQQPLIIRGPGAGAEVTAAGVFSDLIQVAHGLGACV